MIGVGAVGIDRSAILFAFSVTMIVETQRRKATYCQPSRTFYRESVTPPPVSPEQYDTKSGRRGFGGRRRKDAEELAVFSLHNYGLLCKRARALTYGVIPFRVTTPPSLSTGL